MNGSHLPQERSIKKHGNEIEADSEDVNYMM